MMLHQLSFADMCRSGFGHGQHLLFVVLGMWNVGTREIWQVALSEIRTRPAKNIDVGTLQAFYLNLV